MDFDEFHRYPRPPRRTIWTDYPLGSRIGALVLGVVLMIPVAKLVRPDQNARIQTQGLAGAAMPDPVLVTDTSAASMPPTVVLTTETTAAAVTTVATTVPKTAAPTIAISTAAKTAAPVATTAKPATTAATIKPAPTTAKPAPATTAKPVVTTAKPAPATTKAPVTTTTTAAPNKRYSADEAVALIRQMWPDDSEDKAVEIARRESTWRNWVNNGSCCYGLFQINYESHKRRLTSRGLGLQALYDPKVNITIALEIYREQGWSPWTTSYGL